MSEDKIDESELTEAMSDLKTAEVVEREKLKSVLKCTSCNKTMEIPEDIKTKMENNEDLGTLPNCSCGSTTAISITSS